MEIISILIKVSMTSLWGLFVQAEWAVKLVMIGLILASIWSWTIIIYKILKLKKLNRLSNAFEDSFWSGAALDDLFDKMKGKALEPMGAVFHAAMREWRRGLSKGLKGRGTLEQRIERVMHVSVNREIAFLERHVGFLSSLGTNAVIIGLFGTVLGIMNSFQSIATQQSANLSVVAPGIAEALFATAIGLIAAIPASIAYNKISSDISRYAARLEDFANEFSTIISRQIEEHIS